MRKSRTRLGGLLVVAVMACTVLVSCGGEPSSPTRSAQPTVTRSPEGLLTWHGLPDPNIWDTRFGFVLTWVTSPLGRAPVREEVARVDARDGKVRAERSVGGTVLDALGADGSLFVTVLSSEGLSLLRIHPESLMTIHSWNVVSGRIEFAGGTVVSAEGGIWVSGGDRLDRVDPANNRIVRSIDLPGFSISEVTSNSTGTALVLSVSDEGGAGYVERRDPESGGLLGTSAQITGVRGPFVEGVAGDDLWVNVPTGNMGFTELFSLVTLAPVGAPCDEGLSSPTCLVGTNGITAQLVRGLLWVTQYAGGPSRNFCGRPDGTYLAPLPTGDDFVAIGTESRVLFALGQVVPPHKSSTLSEVPVPSECR